MRLTWNRYMHLCGFYDHIHRCIYKFVILYYTNHTKLHEQILTKIKKIFRNYPIFYLENYVSTNKFKKKRVLFF
jgi:hypothetical protein